MNTSPKTISIIGAGISGLSAGCYLQMNGFKTCIYEKHDLPGGLCTSWEKGGYTFDGSVQWILGTGPGSSFYKMWTEILDMQNITFVNHEYRILLEVNENENVDGNKNFIFYNNLNKLEQYLLHLAPEDDKIIRQFIKEVRSLQKYDLPPVHKDNGFWKNLINSFSMIRYLPLGIKFIKLKNETNKTFAKKFNNPFLREVFDQLFDQFEVNLLVLMVPMAAYDQKSAGYPLGGSLHFAKLLEKKYLELGGEIFYKTPVLKINTKQNIGESITVRNNKVIHQDYIISAADWKMTISDLLSNKFDLLNQKRLISQQMFIPYYSSLQCSFGVALDLKDYPHFSRFPLETELCSPDGMQYNRFEIHVYNYDPTLTPAGKSCVIVNFYTQCADYWIELRKNQRQEYRNIKKEWIEKVIDIIDLKIPTFRSNLEAWDLSTPATYLRYTNNWKGSTQGWLPNANILKPSPVKLKIPGLKNVFVASHWNQPGGGLPIAISKGREVTQLICKLEKKKFITKT